MGDPGPEKIEGEHMDTEFDEVAEFNSAEDIGLSDYAPRDIIEFEEEEDIPEWLEHQVIKMRKRADIVKDVLDIYSHFVDEELDSVPSEVEEYLLEHGFEQDEDPLNYLVKLGAENAVKLEERRNLVNDNYNGIGKFGGTGLRSKLNQETRDKINAELANASYTLTEVERSGATTEGGYTPPKPLDVQPEKSLGLKYRELLEEEAEEVDWIFERRAYRD
jgi:hypothetical protein